MNMKGKRNEHTRFQDLIYVDEHGNTPQQIDEMNEINEGLPKCMDCKEQDICFHTHEWWAREKKEQMAYEKRHEKELHWEEDAFDDLCLKNPRTHSHYFEIHKKPEGEECVRVCKYCNAVTHLEGGNPYAECEDDDD